MVFVSLLFFAQSLFADPVVEFKPLVKISGKENIRIADIIEVPPYRNNLIEDLKRIVLSDAPQIGEKRVYTNKALSEIVRYYQAQLKQQTKQNWSFKIPSRVVVEYKSFELNREDVEGQLLAKWKKVCTDCLFLVQTLSLPMMPDDVKTAKWSLKIDNNLPKGSFSIPIKVENDNDSRLYWITGTVDIHKKVAVVNKTASTGYRLQANDVDFEWRSVTYATDTSPKIDEIVGKQLVRGLIARDIIWYSSLKKDKAIERGDIVKVNIGDSQWQASLTALAEQDGFVGDSVKLRNMQTQKIMTAKVTGFREAVINE